MSYSPILIAYACAGNVGLLSGTAAMCFRKGSPRHVLAGKIFVASMVTMAAGAVYLTIVRHRPNNLGGGILTFYLIGAAWPTARRGEGETSRYDWVALLIPLTVGSLTWMSGIEKMRTPGPPKDGVPSGMHFFLGSAALLAAAGDVRLRLRGGVFGAKRLARHLWRMSFGLFIAFFSRALEPPAAIAFGSGDRATPVPGYFWRTLVFSSDHSSTDSADFLAHPSSLRKDTQEHGSLAAGPKPSLSVR